MSTPTNLMDFADEYAKQVADAPVTNNIPQRQFAISQISAARDALSDAIAACDARHRQELAAYELTVSNLRAELAQQGRKPLRSVHRRWIATTWLTPASIIDAVEAAHGTQGVNMLTDEQIKALYQKYGTGRLDGFTAAVRDAEAAATAPLLEALRLVMSCAGEIATVPDSLLEMALDDGDKETRDQANAFLVARAAIVRATGGET